MNETIIAIVGKTIPKSSLLISTIDPNWLYSSIAQSSAAIVGLMGAFLTTKLMTQKSIIKELETQIKDNKAKIEFLKESIKEKEEWVKKIDYEEDLEDMKEFLKEIQDEVDIDNPPSVDELIKLAKKQDFNNIPRKMLEKIYPEYLERVKIRRIRKKSAFGGWLDMIEMPEITLINPQISTTKRNRYTQYNDEINHTYSEIKYFENLIKSKENEINIAKAGLDLKKTLFYLAVFSIIGVFLPLFMLSLNAEIMYSSRFIIVSVVLLSWIAILAYLINEIRGLTKNKSSE